MKHCIKFLSTILCLALLLGGICPAYGISCEAAGISKTKIESPSQMFEPVWKSQTKLKEDNETKKNWFIVKKNYCAARTTPSEKGKIVNRLHAGEFLYGEVVKNNHNNEWLKYYDSVKREYYYVYLGNLTKHDTHTWYAIEDNDTGWYGYCECGFVHFEYYNNPDASFDFDIVEVFKQIALGNYSDSFSFSAVVASIALGFTPVGTLMDFRDLTADVVQCAKGSCNVTSLALDMAAFLPLMDVAKYADNLRVVKQLDDVDDMYVATYKELRKIYKGKSKELGIEVHHLLEKRFVKCVNVAENDFIATAVLKSEHLAYTKVFRKHFPYGTHYKSVKLSDMQDAIREAYADNPELMEQTLAWVTKHWTGRK